MNKYTVIVLIYDRTIWYIVHRFSVSACHSSSVSQVRGSSKRSFQSFKSQAPPRPFAVRGDLFEGIVTSSRRHVVTSSFMYTLMMMCGACLRRREVCLTKLLRKESCVHVDQTRAIQHLTQKNTHTKSIGTALIQGHSSFHCHRRRTTTLHLFARHYSTPRKLTWRRDRPG